MKRYTKYTSKILFSIFLLINMLFYCVLLFQILASRKLIIHKAPYHLETSVRKYIENKSKEIYYSGRYEYNPENRKIGEYETRTATYADTTFTYQSKITDAGTAAFNGIQTLLLDTDQLHADSLQAIFNEQLRTNHIYAQSIIGITASFYTKKNEWSSDTTSLSINHRIAFTGQGNYEDINYYAYIHYSPYTIWKVMNKTPIFILFICIIISGASLLWWRQRKKKEALLGITHLKNGNYRIKDILFNVKEQTLASEDKEIKVSTLPHELLLMFLNANDHKVAKKDIKNQFWPKHTDPTSNMTSTVNRLNKVLKDINCTYSIITDPKNEEVYVFISDSDSSLVTSVSPPASL